MSMPPLPPTSTFQRFDGGKTVQAHTDAAMREYGALCRRVAIEQAAQVCAVVCSERWDKWGDGYNQGSLDCETRIKELK